MVSKHNAARPRTLPAVSKYISGYRGHKAPDAVFTRPEVAEFILDLTGYTADIPLYEMRILEPSFGAGNFLIPIVKRLLDSWRERNRRGALLDISLMGNAIRAVESRRDIFDKTTANILAILEDEGIDSDTGSRLTNNWLSHDDFLLSTLSGNFNFAVGNPPYIRPERIPAKLLKKYRSLYNTMSDRADIYVPFIERSLSLLTRGGRLGFICSDRWMKNKYGDKLRNLVAQDFHFNIFVDMVETSAFQSQVTAYPAIIVISREEAGPTRVASNPAIDKISLTSLARELLAKDLPKNTGSAREIVGVVSGANPWLLESLERGSIIRRIESEFPLLQDAGCKVGIGVATGADKEFIHDYDALDVEPDRKLKLVKTDDIVSGEVNWRGLGVINPFSENGQLVNLAEYPLLEKYLTERKTTLSRRYCARKNPANWYRALDRIRPQLASTPKLLIPDIKAEANVVYENGRFYPHHNLYYILADNWNLRALQAVLLSEITRLFIAAYSTKMRGGYLRFQARNLRRLHVPRWSDVPGQSRSALIDAGTRRDQDACDLAASKLYRLTSHERFVLNLKGE